MRNIICFLMGLSLFLGMTAFTETVSSAGQCIDGKLYVEPGTVHVAPNGIFLILEGNFVPVEVVCMDEGGVYVLGYKAVRWVKCPKPDCQRIYDADKYTSECPHNRMRVCR